MKAIKTKLTQTVLISLGTLLISACVGSGGVKTPGPVTDPATGCKRPPVQFIAYAREFKLSVLEKGNFDYKSNPKLFSAFSHTAKNMLIIQYQVCIAQRAYKYSPAQAEWLRSNLLFFSSSKPSAKAAARWVKNNPFPKGSAVDGRGRNVYAKTTGDCSPIVVGAKNVVIKCGG